jgi:hypothetical protein
MFRRLFHLTSIFAALSFGSVGFADGPDFVPPALELSIPPGARPTSENVRVVHDFSGMTPNEALTLVLSRQQETLHSENERFVSDIILQTHKAWTLALNNVFVLSSNPARTFAETQLATGAQLTFIGVMSAMNPVWARVVETNGSMQWFVNKSGRYELEAEPNYHILFEAEVRYNPEAGIKINHPIWSDPRLSQPIRGQIIESP